jgi:hypothetical protein
VEGAKKKKAHSGICPTVGKKSSNNPQRQESEMAMLGIFPAQAQAEGSAGRGARIFRKKLINSKEHNIFFFFN